jgi:DNA polymerase-1
MFIDIDYLNKQIPKIEKAIAKLEREINRAAGQVVSMKSAEGKQININAPKQLAHLFFGPKKEGGMGLTPIKMTKGGATLPQPSVDKDVMEALEETTELAAMILKCRSLQKTRSTYLLALKEMAEYFKDGRIHPQFNQFGARTGRLSTQNPNSQNFPRADNDDWGIRHAFIAPPGKKLIVVDWSQLEMRIMADQSGDKVMINAIKEGKDLHSFTASRMVPGVAYEDVIAAKKSEKPDQKQKLLLRLRQDAKPVGFGIIYGAGPPTISKNITIPPEDIAKKLAEMPPRKFKSRLKATMKKNPLLTEEQAAEKVAAHSIAGDKIEAYFKVFPRVKTFMDYIPELCRDTRYTDFPEHVSLEELDDLKQVITDKDGNRRDGRIREWGFVQTLVGRYRRLHDIAHTSYTFRGHAEREAVNTKIQGTAADMAKAAMLRVERSRKLNRLSCKLLNQIHDELVVEVPEENAEEAAEIIRRYMEHPFGDKVEALCVPTPVDLKICDRWSEGK